MKVQAIFGPPGTGKTRKLVDIAFKEREARGVLYLSYTKAAAAEAVSRIDDVRIKPSTLHSFAFRELNMNRAAVVDKKKLMEFGKVTGIPFMGSEKGSDEPQEGDDYATVLEYANNRVIPPMEAYERFGKPGTQHRFENFVTEYQAWKKTYGYMDFDNMLMEFTRCPFLNASAEVVLLDEAQDCTPMQWLAFIKIVEHTKRVYIAGDDDQAIYEWSGADPHGMVKFAESHDGEQMVLEQSYRVPAVVHDFVHKKILGFIKNRKDKKFEPRIGDQGSVHDFGDFWDYPMAEMLKGGGSAMILARDRFRLEEIKRDLNRQMIPYEVLGGVSPWTNKIAQDLREGKKVEIPPWWVDFYAQADLNQPVRLQLSTIHQAKGREANRVIVDLQCTARVLHNIYLDPDAERRVWYVALTRAKQKLALCGENPVLSS